MTKFLTARVDVATARKAVALAKKAGGRTPPVLEGVNLSAHDGRLRLSATDLDVAMTVDVPSWDVAGSPVVVSAGLLGRVLRGVPAGTATLTADDETLTVTVGPVEASVRLFPVIDWPALPPPVDGGHSLTADEMGLLARVASAAADTDGRPVLTGVYLDGTRASATDSYRAFTARVSRRRLADGAVVPAATITLVATSARGRDVTLACDGHKASWRWSRDDLDVVLSQPHIEAGSILYPDVPKLMGDALDPSPVTVDRQAWADVVRRHVAVLHGSRGNSPTTFTPGDGGLVVESKTADHVLSETVDLAGFTVRCAFNPRLLLSVLDACAGPTVGLYQRDDELKPIAVGDGTLTALLMPMRVDTTDVAPTTANRRSKRRAA